MEFRRVLFRSLWSAIFYRPGSLRLRKRPLRETITRKLGRLEMADKVAVIAGAGSGLSAALARRFAGAGFKIALAARATAKLNGLVVVTKTGRASCWERVCKEV